jgi:hypothetical protein
MTTSGYDGYPVYVLRDGIRLSDQNPLPVSVANFMLSDQSTIPVSLVNFAPTHTDAFGRLRVSHTFTLFDSFHRFADNGKIGEYVSGTASSAHDTNAGSVVMTIGGAIGDKIYRESLRVFAYQPGKSLLVLQTFCMSVAKSGLRQRHGYFDVSNGLYIQMLGSILSLVRRSSSSGVLKETIVEKGTWNVDNLDGNGPSGFVLDITRAQILFIDIEWLGVGSVRMGFVIEGKFCLCHIFHHANQAATAVSDTTLPYMTTACLPVRTELENVSATGSASSYRVICTSIMSEGGYELRGRQRSVGTEMLDSPKNLPAKNTFYPVVSIRLKATHRNGIVVPTHFALIGTASSDYKWQIVMGATISGGGSWVSAGDDSCVESKLDGTNAITDGTVLKSGFFTSSASSSPIVSLEPGAFKFQLERNSFTQVAYTFTLAVAGRQLNDKVLGSIDWEEVT